MKKVFTILTVLLLTVGVFAQSPEKMSYQAVIRDNSNALVTNTLVGMQISILQGSAGGTAVYAETQTPTTNANGLVSIEIGGDDATVVTGSFSAIDWASGPYYIKTETDPTGGTSYTITGTNQLLSVPYALHAETVTGTITETDPVYSASQATNITSADITNLGNLSGTNTGDQDLSALATQTALVDSTAQIRSEIPDVSGIDINTQAIQDTAAQIRADIPAVKTYSVGDFAQGGVVFYVDETGQHGLACAIEDQDGGSGIQWSNGSYIATEASDGVYVGEMNTLLIIGNQGATLTDYAAGVCANYSVTQNSITYGDWYLPSKYELDLMYDNKTIINATAIANSGSSFASAYYYWSSTEQSSDRAHEQYFGNGGQTDNSKASADRVRAVRAF